MIQTPRLLVILTGLILQVASSGQEEPPESTLPSAKELQARFADARQHVKERFADLCGSVPKVF